MKFLCSLRQLSLLMIGLYYSQRSIPIRRQQRHNNNNNKQHYISISIFVTAAAGMTQRICTNDNDCQKFHPTSTCIQSTNTCTNPYHQYGCLASRKWRTSATTTATTTTTTTTTSRLKDTDTTTTQASTNSTTTTSTMNPIFSPNYKSTRVCSSADLAAAATTTTPFPDAYKNGYCISPSSWNYTEIRLVANNWESAFFVNWIVQIILSEILHVPTSIETGLVNTIGIGDFYDPMNRVGFGKGYDWDAIRLATTISDCRLVNNQITTTEQQQIQTNDTSLTYQSCAHASLETWEGQIQNIQQLQQDEYIEKPSTLGLLGNAGWYIPWFTGENHPSLLTYLGMQGQGNRKKLAETFLRPTKWIDYCNQVSMTNCSVPDDVAQRYPNNSINNEDSMMFLQGQYTGYFRATEENDCGTEQQPKNCTGHIVDYPCGWSSFVQQQTYHLDIALASSGDEHICKGYKYSQMLEIWAAANATRSNVIMLYWTPDALLDTYFGTEAEFLRVSLPSPTQQCFENRVSPIYRCDDNNTNISKLVGPSVGACDEKPQILVKVIAKNLIDITNNPNVPPAIHSPAYELIQNFELTALQLGVIFEKWIKGTFTPISNDNNDNNNNNNSNGHENYRFDAREAACEWVIENLDYLQGMIPRTFPRTVVEGENLVTEPLHYVALVISVLALVFVTVIAIRVFMLRKRRVFMVAQVEFVFLVLFGLVLVQIGAVAIAVPPTNGSCVFSIWAIYIGYTIELVPLLVKVGAINRLMTAARHFRRLQIDQKRLLVNVALVTSIAMGYLCAWTVIDPPWEAKEYILTDTINDNGDTIVKVFTFCNSQDRRWGLGAMVWRSILLLSATILAFQTRNSPVNVNESRTLAIMVYFQFSFLIGYLLLSLLQGKIESTQLARYKSIAYSIDVISVTCIYFIPKLLLTDTKWIELVMEQNQGSLAIFQATTCQPSSSGLATRSSLYQKRFSGGTGGGVGGQTSSLQFKDSNATNIDGTVGTTVNALLSPIVEASERTDCDGKENTITSPTDDATITDPPPQRRRTLFEHLSTIFQPDVISNSILESLLDDVSDSEVEDTLQESFVSSFHIHKATGICTCTVSYVDAKGEFHKLFLTSEDTQDVPD